MPLMQLEELTKIVKEDLSSIEEINKEEQKKLIVFCDKLKEIETEFKKINPNVKIVLNAAYSWDGVNEKEITDVEFTLKDGSRVIEELATNKKFLRNENSSLEYNNKVSSESCEPVIFSIEPELYMKITEDYLIKSFLQDEKNIRFNRNREDFSIAVKKYN